MKAHFCLSKKENIDSDFDGIIEIQVNTETPGFQVTLLLIFLEALWVIRLSIYDI